MPKGYSPSQIRLHWVIFVLVVLQYVLHEPISKAWEAIEQGQEPAFSLLILAHVVGGILILVLAVWRVVLRRRRGAPDLPGNEPEILKLAALVTHTLLNLLIIFLPISGALAFFGHLETAAEVHGLLRGALLVLVVVHILAALYHQFVLKTNLLARMFVPDRG